MWIYIYSHTDTYITIPLSYLPKKAHFFVYCTTPRTSSTWIKICERHLLELWNMVTLSLNSGKSPELWWSKDTRNREVLWKLAKHHNIITIFTNLNSLEVTVKNKSGLVRWQPWHGGVPNFHDPGIQRDGLRFKATLKSHRGPQPAREVVSREWPWGIQLQGNS